MFPVNPNVIGPAAYGAWQATRLPRGYRGGGSAGSGGDASLGGWLLLALIAGLVIYFIF